MTKQEQLHNAIEVVSDHQWDAHLVLAGNMTNGQELQSGYGTLEQQAALIADLFLKQPQLEQEVKKLQEEANKVEPDLIAIALARLLGGDQSGQAK